MQIRTRSTSPLLEQLDRDTLVVSMGALDLLFTAKLTSERLHQAALMVLLAETPLLSRLTGIVLDTPKIEWEPDGGDFDLLATDKTGKRLLIELKVDGKLSRKQVNLQGDNPATSAIPIGIFVGTSAIKSGQRWGHWQASGEGHSVRIFDGASVLTTIEDLLPDITDKNVRELAESYVRVLKQLAGRTREYRNKSVQDFSEVDFLGYFDELRQVAGLGRATVEKVDNAAGGFTCCAWEVVPSRIGGLYLQFENSTLCLKIRAGDINKGKQRQARSGALEAALRAAQKYPQLAVEPSKGKAGKTMTLLRLRGIKLASDPSDEGLLSSLREALDFVKATAAMLG